MRLGIDASNLRAGGGITHLVEMLHGANPRPHGFSQVIVWGGKATLKQVGDYPWLEKRHQPLLDRGLPYRLFWKRFRLSKLARRAACDLLFVPGGAYAGDFRPVVTMSRNLLPFVWREIFRYGLSLMTLKWFLLRWSQSATFRKADGVIFLTKYAQQAVLHVTGSLLGQVTIIPHGVDHRFLRAPRSQRGLNEYTSANPFRILYVSIIDAYKHQWNVADAVACLRAEGLPVVLDLVGPAYTPALKRLEKALQRVDPNRLFIRYLGGLPHQELHRLYSAADACVFASSCENMPNILLEGMASGLPIACSDRGPMPEILGEGGVYFDPEDVRSITNAIHLLLASSELRAAKACAAYERIIPYSWQRCATETFRFLADIATNVRGSL